MCQERLTDEEVRELIESELGHKCTIVFQGGETKRFSKVSICLEELLELRKKKRLRRYEGSLQINPPPDLITMEGLERIKESCSRCGCTSCPIYHQCEIFREFFPLAPCTWTERMMQSILEKVRSDYERNE